MSSFINAELNFGYEFDSVELEIGQCFGRTAIDGRFWGINLLFKTP